MDKYQGIQRAEAKFSEAGEIRCKGKGRKDDGGNSGGYLAGFFMRIVLAGLLLAAIFGLKFAAFSFSDTVVETVKSAVTFDMNEPADTEEFLTEKLKELLGG